MESNAPVLIIALIVEAVAAYFLIKNSNMYKLIKSAETSRISHLRKGFYEIKGRVVALEPHLITPFSEKPCVYYNFRVEQKRSSGKSSHWVKMLEDKKFLKFGVNDGSGVAMIDMQSAKIELKMDRKERSGIFNSATDHQQRVLEKYGKNSKNWFFQKTLRYHETFLEEGDEVYVIGEVVGSEKDYPLFRRGEKPFFVSDKSEDQLISQYRNWTYISVTAMVIAGFAALFAVVN